MRPDNESENIKALEASRDPEKRNDFLKDSQDHIIRLASALSGRIITKSDDDFSIALIAVSEALDKYDEKKGNFWSFAATVMKARLTDLYRKSQKSARELSLSPSAFEGEVNDEEAGFSFELELKDKLSDNSTVIDNDLRDEILALSEELKQYNISFFDLAGHSPKTKSTRDACSKAIKAFFLPPPLMEALRKTGLFPAKEVMKREKLSRKFIDKFRKYLIVSALIIDGDYPGLYEYIRFLN